jgi:hypothetical protein
LKLKSPPTGGPSAHASLAARAATRSPRRRARAAYQELSGQARAAMRNAPSRLPTAHAARIWSTCDARGPYEPSRQRARFSAEFIAALLGITLDPGLMLRRHELDGVRKPYSSPCRHRTYAMRRQKGWIRTTASRPTRPTSISIVMAGQMAHSNNIPPMLRAVLRVRKSHLQRTGNFPPGVSGFYGTSLQGNPDGHGKAPIRQ